MAKRDDYATPQVDMFEGSRRQLLKRQTQAGLKKRKKVDTAAIERAVLNILIAMGEDPAREGLKGTPKRVAKFWKEFVEYKPGKISTAFKSPGTGLVVVSGMRIHSHCEHHMLPFWCDVAIGYIPNGKVLGLSKFARIAHMHAHKLQIQERLVTQIGETVEGLADTPHVIVHAKGEHSCMTMRGVSTHGLMMSTHATGDFLTDAGLKAEFLSAIK